ncbi:MAG: ATP-binding cassette domain-containing protein, partial [Thermoproteota archaeon]
MEAPEIVVDVKEVTKDYVLRSGVVKALKGIDLQVKRGEYVVVMGPSGSGKTTLFNMIGGLDKPTSGSVSIDSINLAQMNDRQLAWVRSRKIGYIFQTFNLIPVLSAQDNVALPMVFLGISKEERRKKAAELLSLVGLGDRLSHRP